MNNKINLKATLVISSFFTVLFIPVGFDYVYAQTTDQMIMLNSTASGAFVASVGDCSNFLKINEPTILELSNYNWGCSTRFTEFDLSDIPDGSIITNAVFSHDLLSQNGANYQGCDLLHATLGYSVNNQIPTSFGNVWTDAPVISDENPCSAGIGLKVMNLNSVGVNNLQTAYDDKGYFLVVSKFDNANWGSIERPINIIDHTETLLIYYTVSESTTLVTCGDRTILDEFINQCVIDPNVVNQHEQTTSQHQQIITKQAREISILLAALEQAQQRIEQLTKRIFDLESNTTNVRYCGLPESEYNIIKGTNNPDILVGNSTNDLIFGYAGNDTITGHGGNDCIIGGLDVDIIDGSQGQDTCIDASEDIVANCEILE